MSVIWMDVDIALSEVPVNSVPLTDDTDFKSVEESVAYDAAGMDLYWHFTTTGGVTTVTSVTPTTGGDYDWNHQDHGIYTIEITASGGASINNDTEGFGYFTGFATGVLPWRGPTIGFRAAGLNNKLIDDAYSTTRALAGTALPDAAADAAGGVPTSDLGGLDLDAKLANTNEITVARMGALTDWIDGGRLDLIFDAILLDTGTTLPATLTIIDDFLDTEIAAILAAVDTEIAAILVDTGTTIPALIGTPVADLAADIAAVKVDSAAILVDTGTTLQAEVDAIQAAVITNAAGVDIAADIIALKAETAAILVDTATTLQAELDAIQAAVITNAAGVDIAADIIALKTETAAILVDTGTTLDTKLNTIDDFLDTEVAAILAAVDTEVAAILTDTGTTLPGQITAVFTDAMTESYRSTGATGSPAQILYEIMAGISEFAISGTTKTAKKLDGATTAKTYTLDDDTNPTSITEAT